jgi:hypothetical protein
LTNRSRNSGNGGEKVVELFLQGFHGLVDERCFLEVGPYLEGELAAGHELVVRETRHVSPSDRIAVPLLQLVRSTVGSFRECELETLSEGG